MSALSKGHTSRRVSASFLNRFDEPEYVNAKLSTSWAGYETGHNNRRIQEDMTTYPIICLSSDTGSTGHNGKQHVTTLDELEKSDATTVTG